MKNFENLSVDSNTSLKNRSLAENFDCETDCCTTEELINGSCCNEDETSSCCDSDSDCCNEPAVSKSEIKEGTATIDGKTVKVTKADSNLVELAKKANVTIPVHPVILRNVKTDVVMPVWLM